MQTVENCEATISTLQEKRQHLIQKAVELADERQKLSFSAHADNDQKAKQRLTAIHGEIAQQASAMESISAALAEAEKRSALARTAEATALDRDNALLLKEKLNQFYALGIDVDEAFEDAMKSVNEMMVLLEDMRSLGPVPTADQFRVNGTICLKSLIQQLPTPWVRDFEFSRLAPNQKKTFKSVVEAWTGMIARNIAARLGEKQEAA